MHTNNMTGYNGLSRISTKSHDVAQYYNNWAVNYDDTLANWQYDAPEQVAKMLRTELSHEAIVLDAGCGTGLSGQALCMTGFQTIDGIDISSRALQIARGLGIYRTLQEIDMQKTPLPISNNQYDGLVCVGALTYLADSDRMLREFNRIVQSGGVVVLTQRNDLFVERSFQDVLKTLTDEGVIRRVTVSEAHPYLPKNEEFADRLLVHYVSYTVV